MKNTNRNDYKQALKNYLEPIIQQRIKDQDEPPNEKNIYTGIISIAMNETPLEFQRRGVQNGLISWLRGLGMNIDYSYAKMIEVAERLHECKLTEKERDIVCENWWKHIACKILQFSDY